jgi:hypothetical protein
MARDDKQVVHIDPCIVLFDPGFGEGPTVLASFNDDLLSVDEFAQKVAAGVAIVGRLDLCNRSVRSFL